jgi:glucokinase
MPELCIDFGGTNVKLGLLRDGVVLASREFAVSGTAADLAEAERVALELAAGDSESDSTASAFTAVGIALPGVVDQATGSLVKANEKYGYLGGVDLREWASTRFGAPAVVENDARAALIGETSYGCASGATDAVLLTLGTGIGTAAMMDGRVLRGRHDHAGILGGHVTVDLNAPTCPCGNIGCAESLASTWALGAQLSSEPRFAESPLAQFLTATDSIGLKELFTAAATDLDPSAREIVDSYLRIWGAAIVTLCHAYDPEVVIVSGGVMRARDAVLPRLRSYVHEHLWSSSHRPRFVSPDAPDLSVLRGLSAIAQSANVRTPEQASQQRSTRRFD